jgi:hypothetical protein
MVPMSVTSQQRFILTDKSIGVRLSRDFSKLVDQHVAEKKKWFYFSQEYKNKLSKFHEKMEVINSDIFFGDLLKTIFVSFSN